MELPISGNECTNINSTMRSSFAFIVSANLAKHILSFFSHTIFLFAETQVLYLARWWASAFLMYARAICRVKTNSSIAN